ncbi:MAG: type II secretion system F family protein [Candidatus Rokubacteria bacterium]|nr:type II secretion system F family protein [Candidatus Rokubacteria bacterium]MBI2553432.1 type II secretion system F family protein [Candidatus Rokubacteria bacterium]
MPVFVYKAADQRGKTVAGVMEAPDSRAVVERLHREEYYPIEVTPQGAGRGLWLGLPGRGISNRDLVAFTQQLATLVEAGLPLDRALSVLEELTTNPRLKAVVGDVLKSVRGGTSLADALARHHPRPFSRLYVNMVRAGEKGGVLEATLRRLAEFLESMQEFRQAIVSALIYPVLLTAVGGAAVVFLLTFVIPRFAVIFAELGQAVPLPTQILLGVSAALVNYWWLLVGALVAAVVGSRIALSTQEGRLAWDRAALRLPLVGEIVLKAEVARFCRTLGTLLRSGVAVLAALGVVKEMVSNSALARAVERLGDGVKRGAGLSVPMGESGVFPPLALHMVRVGEETGRLEEMLLKVSDTFETDVRTTVKRFIGLLEPIIILTMGVLVAFIVVAMALAIFSINEIPL